MHIAKKEKTCFEENTEGVTEQTFDKEVCMGVNYELNEPAQQKQE